MARKTIFFSVCLAVSIICVNAGGQFSILHSSDSIHFSGSSKLPESQLKDVYSACMGLSITENCDWNGVSIVDPFDLPEAVVQVYIDGISRLVDSAHWKSKDYPLSVDEYEPDMFESLEHRIRQRVPSGSNKLVNIKLRDTKELNSYSDIFGKIGHIKPAKQTFKHLKYTNDVDHQFLTELEALKAIIAKVESGVIVPDNALDFYNFRFSSLHALSDFHGPNSLQAKEAKKLLIKEIEELSDAFQKAYDGSVLVTVVTTDVAHTRRVRSVDAAAVTRQDIDDGAYSPDYAAIFNIILWFSVVFVFTLVAIVYAIMDMDPGRDSIIYRMTNTRMKKDN